MEREKMSDVLSTEKKRRRLEKRKTFQMDVDPT